MNERAGLLVRGGWIFLPVVLDPEAAEEMAAFGREGEAARSAGEFSGEPVCRFQGRWWVRAMQLASLSDHYESLFPDDAARVRASTRQERAGPAGAAVDGHLRCLLFEILPHFLKRPLRLHGTPDEDTSLLNRLASRWGVPEAYRRLAFAILDTSPNAPEAEEPRGGPPSVPDGPVSARDLRRHLRRTFRAALDLREHGGFRKAVRAMTALAGGDPDALGVLLRVATEGFLEIDGFGFQRIGTSHDYVIYKRTGEYALKDYYDRVYLFPDCRVAVSTRDLTPVVLERYKHPFLRRWEPHQPICLRHYKPPRTFSAAAAVEALEEGLNALYYGYNARRRNGYHSLDRSTIFDRPVDFDDLKVSRDHPKIASGAVAVTNDFV